jgi:osmotically inducible protein OsmC
MEVTGTSSWKGSWKGGAGTISTTSDTIKENPFSYSSRFEGTPGGRPEELFAVAIAGCFNQALANNLGMIGGFEADNIETSVTVDLGFGGVNNFPTIFSIRIVSNARVIGISKEDFAYCAERARTNYTIAKLLNLETQMIAKLVN